MVRINPMARQRLADDELARLVERAAALQRGAGPLAEAASDDLYRLIPATPEADRGRLLALRRDIHNGRGRPLSATSGLPDSVARWSDNHGQRVACHDQIRSGYGAALASERRALREQLGDPNFLTTLAQSASGVFDAARRYRRHDALDSKDRKAERALVQYLTRAMVRTSPYGRFTGVGLAQPDAGGTALDAVTADTATPQVELDRALFDYVMGGVAPTETDPLVAVPLTARVGDDSVTFFQVGPDTVRRLSAPLNRHTRVLVDLLALGPRRRCAVVADMAAQLGVDTAAADRLVGIALGLGLLVTAWHGDEFVGQPVDQAVLGLTETAVGAGPLRQLQADLARLSTPDDAAGSDDTASRGVDERIALSHDVETAGDELSRLARRPAKLTVNEDYVLDPLLVDPGAYRGALDDLAAVTGLLAAFDRMHVLRALIASTMVERFGPGCRVSLVEQAESLVRAAYRGELALAEHPEAPLGPVDGSLAMLAKVRREALTALQRDLGGGDDVTWAPADVTELVAGLPDRFRIDPACYGVVVQTVDNDVVVNDTYAGHGPMFSRFLHADAVRGGDAVRRLAERLQAIYGPGTRLLEDRGCHSLSINAHPPVLDHHLDPEGWRALHLVHDPDTDAVSIVDGDGAPVKVLALGAQLPELFPYPVRLATWLCSSGRVVLDIPGKLHLSTPAQDATVGYSRLRVGRVIVSRRRWYPGADFPNRADSADDVDYLLALTRWRAAHGVPAEVVLKSLFDGPMAWESLSGAQSRERFFELRRQAKPQYIDMASALMTRVLPRLMERRPAGCVEEALPGLAEGGNAREWMVEMARPSGADRFAWDAGPTSVSAVR